MHFFSCALFSTFLIGSTSLADSNSALELVVKTGNRGYVSSVALTPDGKYLATGSLNGEAILWEVSTGRRIRTINQGETVAVSADGKRILTAAWREAALWDAVTGNKIRSFGSDSTVPFGPLRLAAGIWNVAMSRDAKYIAATLGNFAPLVWDAETGKTIHSFNGHKDFPRAIALSPDGRFLVTGSPDKTAILWDTASGKKIHSLEGHLSEVTCVGITGDGKKILTGSADATAIVWDASNGRKLLTYKEHSARITGLSISADCKHVVTSSDDTKVLFWESTGGKTICCLEHTRPVSSVSMSADGKQLVSGSQTSAFLWGRGVKLQSFENHVASVIGIGMSGNGEYLATASDECNFAPLWHLPSGRIVRRFGTDKRREDIKCLALSEDGKKVITVAINGSASTWNASTGEKCGVLEGEFRLASVSLSANGDFIVGTNCYGEACMWDWSSRRVRISLEAKFTEGNAAVSKDGKRIVIPDGKNVIIWDTAIAKQSCILRGHAMEIASISLAHDDSRVLTTSLDGTVRIWDIATGQPLRIFGRPPTVRTFVMKNGEFVPESPDKADPTEKFKLDNPKVGPGHEGPVNCAALSRDGKFLITASKAAILWDAISGKRLQTFTGHSYDITGVAVSNDCKLLWTASKDATCRLWDIITGKEICRLYSIDAGTEWLVTRPDGYFDCSKGAMKFVTYRIAGTLNVLDDDGTRLRFYRPGLLAEVWRDACGEKSRRESNE